MPILRHKEHPEHEFTAYRFNISGEIPIGISIDKNSAPISELDVRINGEWKDLKQAFKDHDVIPDKLHTMFAEPTNETNRERGHFL